VLYAGYRLDPESGLYQVRFRHYHPTLGRWVQRDPIGYHDGMGLYEYCRSNPVMGVDSTGLVVEKTITGPFNHSGQLVEDQWLWAQGGASGIVKYTVDVDAKCEEKKAKYKGSKVSSWDRKFKTHRKGIEIDTPDNPNTGDLFTFKGGQGISAGEAHKVEIEGLDVGSAEKCPDGYEGEKMKIKFDVVWRKATYLKVKLSIAGYGFDFGEPKFTFVRRESYDLTLDCCCKKK
jgi:RHS repeat-associated protein